MAYAVAIGGDHEAKDQVAAASRGALAWVDGWPINIGDETSAIDTIIGAAKAGDSFAAFTLNLDHLVKLRAEPQFRDAYRLARYVTADGEPVARIARRQHKAMQRTAGSDLFVPLCERAAAENVPIYFFGSNETVLKAITAHLSERTAGKVRIAGTVAPPYGFDPEGPVAQKALDEISASGAGLCFVMLGAPKQEVFSARAVAQGVRCGFVCVGAAGDFIAGHQVRAPSWVQSLGLEWFWRLAGQPRRLAMRYLRCALLLARIELRELLTWRRDDEAAGASNAAGSGRPDLLTLAVRHKGRHLLIAVLAAMTAVYVGTLVPQRYKAAAQVLVDPRDIKVLENQLTPVADAQSIGLTLVESQVLVLGSDGVLSSVVRKLGLADDPNFNGTKRLPVAAMAGDALKRIGISSTSEATDFDATALESLQKVVRIRRIDRTYVIEISSTAGTREQARDIVQGIVDAYLDDQARSRSEVARRTSTELDTGLAVLKANVEAVERKVASYKERNELVGVRGQFVSEQQLADLNSQLISARVELARLEARRRNSNENLLDIDRVPEALASATLRDLRVSLARISQERASLEALLMPKHPAVRAAASNERRIEGLITSELARIRQSSDVELDRARGNVQALESQLAQLREVVNRANTAQVELRELERELEVNRAIYRQAIQRAREAEQMTHVNTTNVRVISPAAADRDRVMPPRGSVMAAFGFLLGGIGSMATMALGQLIGRRRKSIA